jgi:hypothetical protein
VTVSVVLLRRIPDGLSPRREGGNLLPALGKNYCKKTVDHADPSGDMVLIDGLTIPNNVQKTTTEMSKALKKSLAMSSDCIPRCD